MTPTSESTAARVREFIVENFPTLQQSIEDDDNLLGSGFVDSLGILDIVDFVEEEFGILIDEDEFVIENFQSINHIVEFVHAKSEST